jgi:hypothetical protein
VGGILTCLATDKLAASYGGLGARVTG